MYRNSDLNQYQAQQLKIGKPFWRLRETNKGCTLDKIIFLDYDIPERYLLGIFECPYNSYRKERVKIPLNQAFLDKKEASWAALCEQRNHIGSLERALNDAKEHWNQAYADQADPSMAKYANVVTREFT